MATERSKQELKSHESVYAFSNVIHNSRCRFMGPDRTLLKREWQCLAATGRPLQKFCKIDTLEKTENMTTKVILIMIVASLNMAVTTKWNNICFRQVRRKRSISRSMLEELLLFSKFIVHHFSNCAFTNQPQRQCPSWGSLATNADLFATSR